MDYQGSFAFGERHLTNVNAMIFNKDDPEMMKQDRPVLPHAGEADAEGAGLRRIPHPSRLHGPRRREPTAGAAGR